MNKSSTRPSKKRVLRELKKECRDDSIESVMKLTDSNCPVEIRVASMDMPVRQLWRTVPMTVEATA